MLRAAMVLMILAGVLGLPAVLCSAACGGLGRATGANISAREGQAIVDFLTVLGLIASVGSIIVGALATKMKKAISGIAALAFAVCFALLLLMANALGLVSAGLLLIAAIMIFVAPPDQFKKVATD